MKSLFEAFPEGIIVDSAHHTHSNCYKLFSFVVHDVFGKSEENVNLTRVLEMFKENNIGFKNIQVVMTDKAVHENAVLCEMLPQARPLLCQWHVITWLKKQAARYVGAAKADVKSLLSILVYAKSTEE
ncbi:hypothetical protein F442_07752 [Phytophthora nicotianae P10297]|uniref:ZSWIM1/3 RNaseH-like domain-containing protein n=1 Tax=Phytophthora nicotianae P10297 TaxID=1317064 RepID=W2ZFT8_PHYNI|nr:hypothetical protein F442_07752 [Phytophthora nicotianae P10297]